jgi:DNA-binding NarL/FixJ family response regulator
MSRTMAAKLLAHLRQAAATAELASSTERLGAEQLTNREREVLELLATGARDREIAERLTVAENTVKRHVQSILQKLGARSRTEVVARLRRGQLQAF